MGPGDSRVCERSLGAFARDGVATPLWIRGDRMLWPKPAPFWPVEAISHDLQRFLNVDVPLRPLSRPPVIIGVANKKTYISIKVSILFGFKSLVV